MRERIVKRITELEQAERDTTMQLAAIRTVLAELRDLLAPAPPEAPDPTADLGTISGAPLGEQDA